MKILIAPPVEKQKREKADGRERRESECKRTKTRTLAKARLAKASTNEQYCKHCKVECPWRTPGRLDKSCTGLYKSNPGQAEQQTQTAAALRARDSILRWTRCRRWSRQRCGRSRFLLERWGLDADSADSPRLRVQGSLPGLPPHKPPISTQALSHLPGHTQSASLIHPPHHLRQQFL